MWKLILLVAADTGKTQYKTGAVQNLKDRRFDLYSVKWKKRR